MFIMTPPKLMIATRYWHELLLSGPREIDTFLDHADRAGLSIEFGETSSDSRFVGMSVRLDQAEDQIKRLEAELAAARGEQPPDRHAPVRVPRDPHRAAPREQPRE